MENEWTILVSTKDTLLVYYCVDSLGEEDEGVLLLSKTKEISSKDKSKVKQALTRIGVDFKDMCSINPIESC